MRKFIDRVDHVLGRAFARVLGGLCLLAGLGSFAMGLYGFRAQGFTWSLLLPFGAGLGFSWIGFMLWRTRRRLSEFDWSGM